MTFGSLYLDNGSRIKYSHIRKFRKLYKKNRKRIVKEKGVKEIDFNTWIKIREETFSKKKDQNKKAIHPQGSDCYWELYHKNIIKFDRHWLCDQSLLNTTQLLGLVQYIDPEVSTSTPTAKLDQRFNTENLLEYRRGIQRSQ